MRCVPSYDVRYCVVCSHLTSEFALWSVTSLGSRLSPVRHHVSNVRFNVYGCVVVFHFSRKWPVPGETSRLKCTFQCAQLRCVDGTDTARSELVVCISIQGSHVRFSAISWKNV